MQRRMVTLVEVLIAIGLLSILLFALLSSYSQLKMVDIAVSKENTKGFEWRRLESRLEAVILQTLEAEGDKSFFYTDHPAFSSYPSLVFSYNAEAKLDPKFSGSVLGRLFVDREGKLQLATWPSPTRYNQPPIPMRVELLAIGIESLSFSFYAPPDVGEGDFLPEPNKWHTEWKRSYKTVPPLMKLHLVKESGESVDFSFYLANNQYPLKL